MLFSLTDSTALGTAMHAGLLVACLALVDDLSGK
jgi:hypothetical protein